MFTFLRFERFVRRDVKLDELFMSRFFFFCFWLVVRNVDHRPGYWIVILDAIEDELAQSRRRRLGRK